jgi:ribonuclease P protein component
LRVRERTGSLAFPRSARLTEAAEFGRVFAGAERVADRFFTVLVVSNRVGEARLGMAVSRRAAPRSVARSRLKRLVREHFRQARAALGAVDCVVLAKPPASTAPNAVLHGSLQRLLQRIAQTCAGASSR